MKHVSGTLLFVHFPRLRYFATQLHAFFFTFVAKFKIKTTIIWNTKNIKRVYLYGA